jgi:hypothetical protein
MRHRSQELHQSANGSRANRRLREGRGSQRRLPVGRVRKARERPAQTKTAYKEKADAKGPRLPLVAEQEWKPAEANGKISLDREGPSHGSRDRGGVAVLRHAGAAFLRLVEARRPDGRSSVSERPFDPAIRPARISAWRLPGAISR